MKQTILIVFGFLLLASSLFLHHLFIARWLYESPYITAISLIALALLAVWFFASFLSARYFNNAIEPPLLINAVNLAFLALILIQNVVFKQTIGQEVAAWL